MTQVAARYGVTVQEVKAWNGLVHERLKVGQTLRVTSDVVPVAKAGGRTKRAVATRGAGKQTASKPAPAKPAATGKQTAHGARERQRAAADRRRPRRAPARAS